MELYLVMALIFSFSLTLIQTESDVCGKYAVLTFLFRFFILSDKKLQSILLTTQICLTS